MTEKEKRKSIYIPNPRRNENSSVEPYQPEYERLNKYPAGYSKDFKEEMNKIKQDFAMNRRRRPTQKQFTLPDQAPNVGNISGHTHERTWDLINDQPTEANESIEASEEFIPPAKFPERAAEALLKFHEFAENQVILIVLDEVYPCSSLEEAEELVEALVFQNKISLEDISILYKHSIKVGVVVR